MKINNKFNFLIETLLMLWFFIVYFFYIYFHPNNITFIPIFFGGLFLLAFWYFAIKPLKNNFNFKIDVELWKLAIFLLTAILAIAVFLRLLGNVFTENLSLIPFAFTEFNVIKNMLIKIIFLASLVLLCASVGKKIFDILKFNIEDKKEEFVFSFGLGFLAINYFAFLLTALGWLYFWPSLILVVAFAAFSWTQIKYFFNIFLKTNFKFSISADFKNVENLQSWVWVIVAIFFIITFLITFRFLSIEYDDLAAYLSIPQLYAYYHGLVPFYNAPAAIPGGIGMAFYALINTLFNPDFIFHLTWLFLVFLLFTVYLFTAKFFSKKTTIITLLLSAFIPWNYFFVTTQKVEFIFAFISSLALFSFFVWLNNNKMQWLYLSAVFLGYAASIKINGLFLIISLSVLIVGLFIFKKINFKKSAVCGLLIALFFLPIALLNFHYYHNPLGLFKTPFSKQTNKPLFKDGKKITLYDIYDKTDFADKRNYELTLLSRQNHISDSSFFNFFWTIWNITVNQKGVKMLYIEISPYLLIFLPFFIFYFIKNKYYKEKNILYLSIVSFIFFILWHLCGAERPWYGIAIFYFLFIFCAIALQNVKNKKYIFVIYFCLILFFLRTITIINFANEYSAIYYSSSKNKQLSDKSLLIYNFINKKIISKNSESIILMFLDSQIANIQESDKKIITDKVSIYWGKILEETESLEEAKNILKNQGVTHILYFFNELKYLIAQNDSENNYKIFKEIEIFEKFKKQYLKKIYCEDRQFCIYEIKK